MKGRIDKNLNIEDNYFPDKFWEDLKKFTKKNLKAIKAIEKKSKIKK